MNYYNCGIYRWTNLINGKCYIGQSKDLLKRKNAFLNFGRRYSGLKIDTARFKYCYPEYWDYQVLEYCSPFELNEKERKYISLYESSIYGYNSTRGGDHGNQMKIDWFSPYRKYWESSPKGNFLLEVGKTKYYFINYF